MECISSILRSSVADSETIYWSNKLKTSFGMDSELKPDVTQGHILLRQSYKCLSMMPEAMVRACKVVKIIFKDLGPSHAFSPNHGFFLPSDNTITLNSDMFYNPDQPEDFFDEHRHFLTRVDQTIFHEFGHAFEDNATHKISLQDPWLKLSGWSKDKEPGLKRIIIKEPGTPEVVGEWWYSPDAEFCRFYGRRNPWDDWADSFAFWVGDLKDKVPDAKREYLNKILSPYYK